mmetsp:Transcript_16020/g.48982  ORF Transcript_16020/g.48982 Transcript_16020/m.48982 type:complete len:203 (-) Transcript_16020:46-654(-)
MIHHLHVESIRQASTHGADAGDRALAHCSARGCKLGEELGLDVGEIASYKRGKVLEHIVQDLEAADGHLHGGSPDAVKEARRQSAHCRARRRLGHLRKHRLEADAADVALLLFAVLYHLEELVHHVVDVGGLHAPHEQWKALDGKALHVPCCVAQELDDHVAQFALALMVHLEGILLQLPEQVGGGHVPKVLVPAGHLVDDE